MTAINRFGKSDCFVITVDELTVKINRKIIFSNKEIPAAMPRKEAVFGRMICTWQDGQTGRLERPGLL